MNNSTLIVLVCLFIVAVVIFLRLFRKVVKVNKRERDGKARDGVYKYSPANDEDVINPSGYSYKGSVGELDHGTPVYIENPMTTTPENENESDQDGVVTFNYGDLPQPDYPNPEPPKQTTPSFDFGGGSFGGGGATGSWSSDESESARNSNLGSGFSDDSKSSSDSSFDSSDY